MGTPEAATSLALITHSLRPSIASRRAPRPGRLEKKRRRAGGGVSDVLFSRWQAKRRIVVLEPASTCVLSAVIPFYSSIYGSSVVFDEKRVVAIKK